MNAPTGQPGPTGTVSSPATTAITATTATTATSAIPAARTGERPYTVHTDAMRPVPQPAPRETAAPRTVRVRTASIIATVTFLLGLGVSMLIGPLGGPPSGGPGGPNGTGGDPGTSQSTTQQSGTSTQQGTGT